MNVRLLLHLVDSVINFGPLKKINAFLFKHFNSILNKFTHSQFALNQQNMKEYAFTFYSNLDKKELELYLDLIAKITFKNHSFTTIDSDNTKLQIVL